MSRCSNRVLGTNDQNGCNILFFILVFLLLFRENHSDDCCCN